MKFCSKLCHDINFESSAIQPCCNVYNTIVPAMPFSGGKLDMDIYRQHLQSVAQQLQTDDSLCKGCPDLVEMPDKSFEIGIGFSNILINMNRNICNCRCTYCQLWKTPKKSYAVLPALKSLAQQNVVNQSCLVSWGGGEPSILKEFDEASLWIIRQGWRQHVFTNAIRYSPSISELLKLFGSSICISLDSASRKTYQDVKQVDKYEQVLANLRRYVDESLSPHNIYLKYIVFDKNNSIEEIEKFITLCASLGIRNVELSFDFREVNGGKLSPKTLIAASFFTERAMALGLNCETFFVRPEQEQEIAQLRERYFGNNSSTDE